MQSVTDKGDTSPFEHTAQMLVIPKAESNPTYFTIISVKNQAWEELNEQTNQLNNNDYFPMVLSKKDWNKMDGGGNIWVGPFRIE